MSKGKKALKIIGILLGGLVGLIIIVYIILNITFGIQLRNKISELKAQGKPMTIAEIIPPPVPDSENAALLYNKVFLLMTSGEGGESYIPNKEGGKNNKIIEAIIDVESYSDISKWTEEQRKEIPKLVNSRDVQYIYDILEEASRRPECNFNPDYEKGFAMLLPHLAKMREVARLLSVRALLEAESGNVTEAFDTLSVGLKVSNHLKDEPTLISQLVRIACGAITIEGIKSISDSKDISSEKATQILNELSAHTDVTPFIKCMDGERVLIGMWGFEGILRADKKAADFGEPRWVLKILVYSGRPILKKDFTSYLTLMSRMQDNYHLPYYQIAGEIQGVEEQIPRYCLLTRMLLPALGKVQEMMARHQADVDVCRVGLALKVYKERNGTYPEELDKLTPHLLREIPLDPFTGKDLIYSKSKDGFLLYSFGPNMEDDGGMPRFRGKAKTEAEKELERKTRDNYDIIWKCEK